MATALKTPFSVEGGRIKVTTDQTVQIEQKIVNALVTNTYERVGLPEYGANLSAAVFENIDTLEYEDFKLDVAQEVANNVTGVSILNITWDEEDSVVNVNVSYRLPLSTPRQFSFRIAVPGVVTEETQL